MHKHTQRYFIIAGSLLTAFTLLSTALSHIDVQAIGPWESSVGFATLNCLIHNLTGVHMQLYSITDWLGLIPVLFAFGFAIFGLSQWIKRKRFLNVDWSILVLGGFYVVVMASYLFFEQHVINYRPVLIEGFLEASYPSSTTILVMCVMPTAVLQFRSRIKNKVFRRIVSSTLIAFTVFMVIGRLISGVHWFTDIVGGALLSAGLVMLYHAVCSLTQTE